MKERAAYLWMDQFRFMAAVMVILDHARDLMIAPLYESKKNGIFYKLFYFFTGFGHEAVVIFFVISGFWISSSVYRRQSDSGFLGHYLIDRLSRLWCVLIPALIIGGALDMVGIHVLHSDIYSGTSGSMSLQNSVSPRISLAIFMGNILFLQNIIVPVFGSNGPLWSLAYEFWYYLWYPAISILIKYRRYSILLLSFIIGLITPKILVGFLIWLMGSAIYHSDRKKVGIRIFRGRYGSLIVIAITLLFCIVATITRLGIFAESICDIAVGLSFSLLLWSILSREPQLFYGGRILARLGSTSSFSVYAAHFPLLTLIAAGCIASHRLLPGPLSVVFMLIGTFVAIIFGVLFSYVTERNTSHVRNIIRWAFRL